MKRQRPRLYSRPPGWPALMTVEVVCAYLGDISKQLLYRWMQQEGFPESTGIGGVRRWSRLAIDAWIGIRSAGARRERKGSARGGLKLETLRVDGANRSGAVQCERGRDPQESGIRRGARGWSQGKCCAGGSTSLPSGVSPMKSARKT